MLVRSQVKYIQSLAHKKFRDEQAVFVAEGPKLVGELLVSGNTPAVDIFGVRDWIDAQPRHPGKSTGHSPYHEVSASELERLSTLTTPNQVVGIFRKPVFPSPDFDQSVTLLLDGIQDPGNLGTIVRIADWFGIRQVVCSPECADVFNAKTVQSTMGSICRVQVLYDELAGWIGRHADLPSYAAVLDGVSLYQLKKIRRGIIVIGNESHGIRQELLTRIAHPLTIPRIGNAESLNAAVATGIILSHVVG
jgi:TrmH family RNA methyltransferase